MQGQGTTFRFCKLLWSMFGKKKVLLSCEVALALASEISYHPRVRREAVTVNLDARAGRGPCDVRACFPSIGGRTEKPPAARRNSQQACGERGGSSARVCFVSPLGLLPCTFFLPFSFPTVFLAVEYWRSDVFNCCIFIAGHHGFGAIYRCSTS